MNLKAILSLLFLYGLIVSTDAQIQVNCSTTFDDEANEIKAVNFVVECAANCSAESEAKVYGSSIYSGNSALCISAIHNSKITDVDGGLVIVEKTFVPASFSGTVSNGITSAALASSSSAFKFVDDLKNSNSDAKHGMNCLDLLRSNQASTFRFNRLVVLSINVLLVRILQAQEYRSEMSFAGAQQRNHDINECEVGIQNCHDNATCTNTFGSFACNCKSGFTGNGTYCLDVNECLQDSTCSNYSNCINSIGSYSCLCKDGYAGNESHCTDIDDCTKETNSCHEKATCQNVPEGFICDCVKGYDGNGTLCTDTDECRASPPPCSHHAVCTNTEGSYSCTCKKGFFGNGRVCSGARSKHQPFEKLLSSMLLFAAFIALFQ